MNAACNPFAANLGWRPFVPGFPAPIIKRKFVNLLLRGQDPSPSPPLPPCHPPPSTSFSGGWTFTINEHWKKQVPMGISCPFSIVHVNVCPCWFGPSGIPLGVQERRPTAQCIDWLIKWKTLLATCALSRTHSVYWDLCKDLPQGPGQPC